MKRSLIHLTAVLLSLCSACAVFGIHPFDQSKANEYAHLDVQQFVKKRFVDEQRTFLDDVGDRMSMLSSQRSSPDLIGKPGLREDGRTVVYEAAFTAVNYGQLVRPRRELELYCGALSGTFSTLEASPGNFVREHFQEGANKRLTIASPPDPRSRHVHIGPKGGQSSGPGFDRDGGEAGYARAQRNGAFGRFACTARGQQWVVEVRPFGYLANDPYDSLSAHRMTLLVAPEAPASAAANSAETPPIPQPQTNPDLEAVRAALSRGKASSEASTSAGAAAPSAPPEPTL